MYCTTYCCDFFLCNEVRKTIPSCNPEKWTLGKIRTALTTYCADFQGLENQTKLNIDNYCTSINVKLAFFTIFVLILQTGFAARCFFGFLQMTLLLNKFAQPWFILCLKKHEWKRSIDANKTRFLQTMLPLKVCKCAAPPDHLRSEVSSRALVTFKIIAKVWKQGEGIWIKCVDFSYFREILHLF